MLDFAQIKAGKFRKNYENFKIKECVDMVINIQMLQAEKKDIYLVSELDGFDDEEEIRTDYQRFAQVLLCL